MLTLNDMIHNYDMVEMLGNCTEKEGVTVFSLVKVAASGSNNQWEHLELLDL